MTQPVMADDVAPERVEWIWRERIPRGMITIVGGRPDQGKGLFVAHLAAEVSRMKVKQADGTFRWGQVLYSAIEDSHGLMTAPRLRAAGANMKNVHLWRFQVPNQAAELENHILDKEIDLVIMDPFAAHLGRGVSRHSDNIRTVLNPLAELIEETRTAVVVVEHVLKRVAKNGHPLAAIGGSGSGLPAASRMAFLFGEDPNDDDARVLASVKANIRDTPRAVAFEVDVKEVEGVGEVPYLMYKDEVDFDPMRLVVIDTKDGKVGRPPDKKAAAAEWLTNYLYAAGKPVAAGKVIEDSKHYGMSTKTLRRAAGDIGVLRNPPGGGKNVTWELPDETIDLLNGVNGIDGISPPPTANVGSDADGALDGELLTEEDMRRLLGDEEVD